MSNDNETRAIEVRQARKAQGLSQEDLAGRANVSVRTIRNVEAGKDVSPATVAVVYNELGMTTPTPSWPDDVDAFLHMLGYRLTSIRDEGKRQSLISDITLMVIGR